MKKQSRPWETKPPQDLTPAEIRRQCKSDLKAWDDFLKADTEVARQESLLEEDGLTIEDFAVGYNDLVEEAPDTKHRHIAAFIHELVTGLTIREREVIQGIFWEKETEHRVAARLKISRSSVQNYRERALKKMGQRAVTKILAIKSLKENAS